MPDSVRASAVEDLWQPETEVIYMLPLTQVITYNHRQCGAEAVVRAVLTGCVCAASLRLDYANTLGMCPN